MRGKAILLLAVVAAAVCGVACAEKASSVDTPPAPTGPDMLSWLPSESWPGGEQYDPRLERRVQFWGAGMPLRDVFASIEEQTGVEIGFWPAGDMNGRVCVNLYLNPEKPPTLRELMAQLRWVTDWGLGVWEEGGEKRYALVGRSAAPGAVDRLREDARRIWRERKEQQQQLAAEMYEKVLGRLEEFGEALALPPQTVASRYKGKDDLIAFAMSSPEMRAAVEFLLGLPEDDLARSSRSFDTDFHLGEQAQCCRVFIKEWQYMAPEQRALLRAALEPTLELNRRRWNARVGPEHQCPEIRWRDDLALRVEVEFSDIGGFRFHAWPTGEESPYYHSGLGAGGPFLAIVPPPQVGMLAADTTIALRRAAGETLTVEDEYWIRDAFETALRHRESRREAQQRMARQEHLSPAKAERLASVALPVDTHEPYSLWQIQEAVAARSGAHVVSDCFCQIARDVDRVAQVLHGGKAPDLTALSVLRLSCAALEGRDAFAKFYRARSSSLSWEWGDAGTFLRFRSTERELWRAAFLPEDVVAMVDGWLAPYLPQLLEAEGSWQEVKIPIDLRAMGRLADRLTEAQRRWGGRLVYGDPGEPANAHRAALREHVFIDIAQHGHLLALLARLTDDGWERLNREGLRWGVDVSPRAEQEADAWARWLGVAEGDVIRLAAREPAADAPAEEVHRREEVHLQVVRDGQVVRWTGLRTGISLWSSSVKRLIAAGVESDDL